MAETTKWSDELSRLKTIIQQTGLTETTKWGTAVYTHQGKNILSIAGFKNHFALIFFQGVFLSDPAQVLSSGEGGKAKAMRQWRFTSADQIDEKRILEYIREAINNAEEGKQHKPEKAAPVPTPPLLEEAFRKDSGLKTAFDALAPYQQRLYKEHISEAKQKATRQSRLEKIKPMILQGIGLHDKYRK